MARVQAQTASGAATPVPILPERKLGPRWRLAAPRYTAAAFCALATIAVVAADYHLLGGALFPNDDAYIALHNAQVLWTGHDAAYRGVPALVGATSGAHLALLLLFEIFIRPDTAALFVLGGAIATVYSLGLFALARAMGCTELVSTLISIAGLAIGGSLFQLLNGLDTGLAMAAVAWCIALAADRRHPYALAALCGAMPFIRPALILLAAGLMLMLMFDRGLPRRDKIGVCVTAAAVTAPFLLWYAADTGAIVPSTVGAKSWFYAQRHVNAREKLAWMTIDLRRALVGIFPLFLCAPFIRPKRLCLALGCFVAAFMLLYFRNFPSAFAHNSGRYLYPLMPIVLAGVAAGLAAPWRWQRIATLAVVIVASVFVPAGFRVERDQYRGGITMYLQSLVDMVTWMNANLPAGATVMVHDAGYIAWAGRFQLVDVVGLKTPRAAQIHKRFTYPSTGANRAEAIIRIAKEFEPRYLLVTHWWNGLFGFADALRAYGWSARDIYNSHAPAGTSPGDIYELYELDRPTR
jgi:hypothetical protein